MYVHRHVRTSDFCRHCLLDEQLGGEGVVTGPLTPLLHIEMLKPIILWREREGGREGWMDGGGRRMEGGREKDGGREGGREEGGVGGMHLNEASFFFL